MSLREYLRSAQEETSHDVASLRQLADQVLAALNDLVGDVRPVREDNGTGFLQALREEAAKTHLLLFLGFSALIERLEQQTEILKEMLVRLKEPERTKAREKQRDGMHAYSNGVATGVHRWFDDAIRDFYAATNIDRYDFVSYWFLGLIYAFDLMADEEAERCFREAAHYSWPENPTASACALVALAFVHHVNGRTQEAEKVAGEAANRDPNLAIAKYQLARYSAANGRFDAARDNLRHAILLDPKLYSSAAVDPLFEGWSGVPELLHQLFEEARIDVSRFLRAYEGQIAAAEDVLQRWDPGSIDRLAEEREEARRISQQIRTASYVDLVASSIRKQALDGCRRVATFILNQLSQVRESRRSSEPGCGPGCAIVLLVWIGGFFVGVAIAAALFHVEDTEELPGAIGFMSFLAGVVLAFADYGVRHLIHERKMRDYKALTEELEIWREGLAGRISATTLFLVEG